MTYIYTMIAIITGDVMGSATSDPAQWLDLLKQFLNTQGRQPVDWEIFRGDAFQLKLPPQCALHQAILLKSRVKQIPELDVRLSIGIGDISFAAERITESNGSAFVLSGRKFDRLKDEKISLAFATNDEAFNESLNLMARFASVIMDNWTPAAAAIVQLFLEQPQQNQQQIAHLLGINQSAVSQSRKRAQFDLLMDFNDFYKVQLKRISV